MVVDCPSLTADMLNANPKKGTNVHPFSELMCYTGVMRTLFLTENCQLKTVLQHYMQQNAAMTPPLPLQQITETGFFAAEPPPAVTGGNPVRDGGKQSQKEQPVWTALCHCVCLII